ncbi:MAG: hypothetical protein JWQ17_4598, partial [Tardiphaga sp.]|nr:hypothetical protein [Tardiphaga sp.]
MPVVILLQTQSDCPPWTGLPLL